jgi:molecular chaperone GrpE
MANGQNNNQIKNEQQINQENKEAVQSQQSEIEALKAELEKYKKEAEEFLNGWKRAKADYLNLKKETEALQAEFAQFITAEIMLKILPIYDDLKKACAMIPEDNNWAQGICNIKKQFDNILKNFGIEEIKTIGEKFNPEFHEAVSQQKKDGVEAGVVIDEVRGGYKMNGKAIIAAKVVVSE